MYTPNYSSGNIYRYLSHIQIYNHCVSYEICNMCSFYNEEDGECRLRNDSFEDITYIKDTLSNAELSIYNILALTDTVCDGVCDKCKFGVKNFLIGGCIRACAPFIAARDLPKFILSHST